MREKILVFSFIILVMSIFIASEAFAECEQGGQTEITFVNQSGKVVEMCVSANAVEHIGGPGSQVIQATCPCFSPGSFDEYSYTRDVDITSVECSDFDQEDGGESSILIFDNGDLEYIAVACDGTDLCELANAIEPVCALFGPGAAGVLVEALTEGQLAACRAIIANSNMWAWNCEG